MDIPEMTFHIAIVVRTKSQLNSNTYTWPLFMTIFDLSCEPWATISVVLNSRMFEQASQADYLVLILFSYFKEDVLNRTYVLD